MITSILLWIAIIASMIAPVHAQVLPGSGPGSQQWQQAPRWDGTKMNYGQGAYVTGFGYYVCSNKFEPHYYLYCR